MKKLLCMASVLLLFLSDRCFCYNEKLAQDIKRAQALYFFQLQLKLFEKLPNSFSSEKRVQQIGKKHGYLSPGVFKRYQKLNALRILNAHKEPDALRKPNKKLVTYAEKLLTELRQEQ